MPFLLRLSPVLLISLAKLDEEALEEFKAKKRALNERTEYLQKTNLHPHLQSEDLSETMESLCHAKGHYSHLSVADQRLMNLMPLSRNEVFAGTELRESLYNVRDTCLLAVHYFIFWIPCIMRIHPPGLQRTHTLYFFIVTNLTRYFVGFATM